MSLATTNDVPVNKECPIWPYPPKSVAWNPVAIVYCQLTMTDPNDPSTALMNPQNYVINIGPGEEDPVGAFIQLRQNDPSAPVKHDSVYVNNDPNKGPLDIFVEDQCYLIIEVDHALAWQFCTSQPCITMKEDYCHSPNNYDNFGLTLDPSGKFASWGVAIRKASAGPHAYNKQGYNIVLQSQGQAVPTIYLIDPDVTNQGGLPSNP